MSAQSGIETSAARSGGDVTVSPPHGYEARVERDLPVLLAWLREYIGRPHQALHRKGPVCPFVPAAMNSGALRVHLRYEISGKDPDELRETLAGDLLSLPATGADQREPALDSLVVAMPDLVGEGLAALDEAHARLKDVAVERGLMIGQFHSACDERSVRNSGFQVSRSPIPVLAVRRMASHDILFLHDRAHWFAAYRARFGGHFTDGRIGDPLLLRLFAAAEARHPAAGGPERRVP
ncbi:DUF6875 domain-containing protein [Streptomyces sp. NBC_01803]|uniref:DUF6875 domain-containing protein n=1 Tax=Streptomyces sp. NBC_01803 TaxID=2975946 RepID=UPI002DDB7548|nr:hypothetical protein [Streptomyces sp. NBC_01803]WSA43091.1 hypothetical protein OIE51_02095 [Streptomyces sp. NBC_01803]